MIRTPLRPLARILDARAQGVNPKGIERENLRLRREQARDQGRRMAEWRLVTLAVAFFLGFAGIGTKMGMLAASPVIESEPHAGERISGDRADILDRNGRLLATNLVTHSLYAEMRYMLDGARAARELARIFPELDAADLEARLTNPDRRFEWIRARVSPEQAQSAHDIGEPGLLLGPRDMRLYPNGTLAAHVLGGTMYGQQGVTAAEIEGVAGIEHHANARLSDPDLSAVPLSLTLDLAVQAIVEEVLESGIRTLNAVGGSVIVMDARSGEVVAMASAPTFDPNNRPPPPRDRHEQAVSPLFNRTVQGLYELGSVMKAFAVAQALELGLVSPSTMVDTRPLRVSRFEITDFRNMGAQNSVTDVFVRSSNTGTARLVQMIGADRQRAFLDSLGFLAPLDLQLLESRSRPRFDPRWSELSAMTIGYGHGLSMTPMHLAAGYAALVNGGTLVTPTLIRRPDTGPGPRVLSAETSFLIRQMMRETVLRGTGRSAEAPGYAVGGKTGTADKPNPDGGYHEDRVITSFAGAFPMTDPRYVFVVTLDEPEDRTGAEPVRTAGRTAAPVAGLLVRRIAPVLGLRPQSEAEIAAAMALR